MRQLIVETVAFSLLVGAVYYLGWQRPFVMPVAPPVQPVPQPPPPEPHRRRIFPREVQEANAEAITIGGSVAPDGKTEVAVDLPSDQLKHNIASRGLGCCVFRSLEYAARWQNLPALYDFPEWMVKNGIEGGGYPEKVDQLISKISQSRSLSTPEYLNVETEDPGILVAALKTGRLPAITYNGRDPHYGGPVAHMTNLVYLDDRFACVRDNNFTGPNELVWLSREEFLSRWKGGGRQGWTVILLAPPPPPPPKNAK